MLHPWAPQGDPLAAGPTLLVGQGPSLAPLGGGGANLHPSFGVPPRWSIVTPDLAMGQSRTLRLLVSPRGRWGHHPWRAWSRLPIPFRYSVPNACSPWKRQLG